MATQRPLMKSLSSSLSGIWCHVGRPWLHCPERSVRSMSRRSAFISGTVSRRFARTAAWHAIVERSSLRRSVSTRRRAELVQLAQHVARELARVGVLEHDRHRAHDEGGGRRGREIETDRQQRFALVFGGRDFQRLGVEHDRHQQRLHRDAFFVERELELLVHDPFVRGVHVDDDEPVGVLGEDVNARKLCKRRAERHLVRGGTHGLGFGLRARRRRASRRKPPACATPSAIGVLASRAIPAATAPQAVRPRGGLRRAPAALRASALLTA